MKKTIITSILAFTISISLAQTATDFTVDDCSSSTHSLFSELDGGKVVVITWVMPCGICIAPAATAATTVTDMANPNVVFYLCDDVANSTCSTIESWASTNGIATDAVFSNAAIDMTDYGTPGMPKTVVLGGSDHSVFYNVNGTISSTDLENAINEGILASTDDVEKNDDDMIGLSLYPNPAAISANMTFTLQKSSPVSIDIINILGQTVSSFILGEQSAGKHEYEMDVESLSEGSYLVMLKAGEISVTSNLAVIR